MRRRFRWGWTGRRAVRLSGNPERAKRNHGRDRPHDTRGHPRISPPDLTGSWNPDQDFITRYGDPFES